MDKKKIISSLTLAGMLATSVAGSGVFAAETSDPATKALGEYSELITGKVAVPFILQSEADRVTGKDVKASFKKAATFTFNSTALTDDQVLATGDVVYINGEARTIVIYGDTNCDGKINIMDAVTTLNHVKGKAELTGAAFAAADLNNNKDINILEAVGVLNAVKAKADYADIATAPVAPVSVIKDVIISNVHTIELVFDNTVEGYTYKLTDKNGKNVECTSINQDTTATITTTLEAGEEYTLTVYDKDLNAIATKTIVYRDLNVPTPVCDKDENGKKTIAINDKNVKNFSMILKLNFTDANEDANEVATNVTVSLVSSDKKVAEASATLPANTVSTSVNFGDLSKLEDGTYNVTVKSTDANGNVKNNNSISDIQVVKASTAPVIYVDAVRNSSDSAKATVNPNVGDLTYYALAKATGEKAPTVSELKENGVTNLNSIPVTEVAQTIYVVAVNKQGTASNIATTEIANHGVATLSYVTDITLNGTEYTWTDSNKEGVKGYQVRVLKGTEVVAETTVTEAKYDIAKVAKENAETAADEFKISVKALGDNKEYANSDVVVAQDEISEKNNLYKVPAIAKVTNVTLDNNAKLTWNTTGITEAKSLTIKLYKAFAAENEAGYEYKEVKAIENVNKSTYEYDLKDVIAKEGVGAYTATVTAIANTDSIKLDSEESANVVTNPNEITQKYVVAVAPTDVTMKVNNTTVTARFSPIVIPGVNNSQEITGLLKNITYKVRVDKKQADGTYTKGNVETVNAPTIAIAEDEKDKVEFDIPGSITITNASDYRITIFAIVDGTEVETKAQEISTPAKMIPKGDYTVVKLQNEESAPSANNKIGITPNGVMKVKVSDETDTTAFAKAPNYEAIKAVVSELNVDEGITVAEDGEVSAINVTTNSKKSRTLNLDKGAEEAALTINGDSTYYINVLGTVKSVVLSTTNGAKYDLSGLTVKETVSLNEKAKEVKVGKGTIVTLVGNVVLNGISINTTGNVKVEGNTLTFLEDIEEDVTVDVTVDEANVVLKTDEGVTIHELIAKNSTVDISKAEIQTLNVMGESNIITDDALVDATIGEITPAKDTKMTVKYYDKIEDEGQEKNNDVIQTISGNVTIKSNTNLSSIDSTKFTGVSFGNRTLEGQPGINATYSVDKNGVLTVEMTSGTIAVKDRTATASAERGIEIDVPAGVDTEKVKLKLSNGTIVSNSIKYENGALKGRFTEANKKVDTLTVNWGNGIVETFTVEE